MVAMSDAQGHIHNALDYLELTVDDLAAAKAFYAAAFGWAFNEYGPGYAGIRRLGASGAASDGEQGGIREDATVALARKNRDAYAAAALALPILYSRTLDETVAAVKRAGGEITKPPFAFPGGRRFHFCDPSGNELAVWSEK